MSCRRTHNVGRLHSSSKVFETRLKTTRVITGVTIENRNLIRDRLNLGGIPHPSPSAPLRGKSFFAPLRQSATNHLSLSRFSYESVMVHRGGSGGSRSWSRVVVQCHKRGSMHWRGGEPIRCCAEIFGAFQCSSHLSRNNLFRPYRD
ncbi:hypothetical protein VN12_14290 [Pirellula sp. SH-Sr6A]|nr:hypothetical protein VN12_14290 [Pirellula sp. SH-Sr6A]